MMSSVARTTINLDEDVLEVVRALAHSERRGLGAVVSTLIRRGLAPQESRVVDDGGFPVFAVKPDTAPLTDEMVKRALEEH